MRTYLVTGGAGFIGSNYIHYMFKKYDNEIRIINVDVLTYAGNLENLKDIENRENYTFVKADICDKEAIAKIFHINKYTVYHLEERKRKTGSVNLQTWRRGRKALLSSADKARIAEHITKNSTINLEELRTQLGLKVSISTMSRVVRALGFRVKKVGLSATERERPRCAGKTYQVE